MRIVIERASITEKAGWVESIEDFFELLLEALLQMGVGRGFPVQNYDVMVSCLQPRVGKLIT